MLACSILRRISPSAKPFPVHCPASTSASASASPARGAQIASQYARRPRSFPLACPFSTRPRSQEQPREASALWTITFTLLALGGGAWLHDKYVNSTDHPPLHPSPAAPHIPSFLGVIDTLTTMPTEPAPGTVGTLTPEQEAKLQEFWVLTLKVFGVPLDALETEPANGKGNADAAPSSSAQDKKKSGKRRGWLWGRSNEDDDDTKSASSANGNTSSLASISITEGDDKHGQSKEFQRALVELQPEEIRTAFWNMVKHDNPDALLLRFLRARKWDVNKALIMLISTMRWRLQEVHVDDDIMANGEAKALKQASSSDAAEKKKGEDFLKQMRLGKSFLHGVDKLGRPICVVRVRLHRAAEQEAESLERFTVYTIETARLLLAPPVETATIIFDMTNFTVANMDYTPVKFMIKCFEANYPESLGTVLIHKAPWIFSSSSISIAITPNIIANPAIGIWSIIKGWLDPVVASKIHFTKNREDLEAFIPPSQIMKELEGDENWEYEYAEIQEGENTQMEDKETRDKLIAERQALAKEIQDITIEWIRASYMKETDAATAAKNKRNGLIEKLREQYWILDPYIRSRSLYDRLNILKGNGKIEFYPEAEKSREDEKKASSNAAAETTGAA
ncbi:CRAL-TRIO domain-containing protein [Penicillium canariense]|uniref:CRAL-TRIO domain-containing protein n=1 Tax=Penicillium canariense TaxID=189055 RepID=A0A9W9IDD9_9EURO|nr:CRAL-TRIO domain-containing protein [Penicillium canariense]KAJ5174352.1 CRAL-TRIO domain-containing protein [Penicillium canariense]